jgi:hypothetical protein
VTAAALAGGSAAALLAAASAGAAPEAVSLFARPSVAGPFEPVILTGRIARREPGQLVSIEVRECGNSHFHIVSGATTAAGGGFATQMFLNGATDVRARLGAVVSRAIHVRARANLVTYRLRRRGDRAIHLFGTMVSPWQPMRGRVLELQRFDRVARRWIAMRRSVFDNRSQGRWTAHFRIVQRGQILRLFLPRSEAGPCYLPTASEVVRW